MFSKCHAVKYRPFRFRSKFWDRKESFYRHFRRGSAYVTLRFGQLCVIAKSDRTSDNRMRFAFAKRLSRQWNDILLSGILASPSFFPLAVCRRTLQRRSALFARSLRFAKSRPSPRWSPTLSSLATFVGFYAIFLALDPFLIRFRLLILLVSPYFFFPRWRRDSRRPGSAHRWKRC